MNILKINTEHATVWLNGQPVGHSTKFVDLLINKIVFIDTYLEYVWFNPETKEEKYKQLIHISYGYCFYIIEYYDCDLAQQMYDNILSEISKL